MTDTHTITVIPTPILTRAVCSCGWVHVETGADQVALCTAAGAAHVANPNPAPPAGEPS